MIFVFFFILIFLIIHVRDKEFYKQDIVFDKIYVISMPPRKKYIQHVMDEYGFDFEMIDANTSENTPMQKLIDDGIVSRDCQLFKNKIYCHASHLYTIKKFIDSGKSNCLIFEDDIKLNDVEKTRHDVSMFMKQVPSDYDMFYLGYCWEYCKQTKRINDYVRQAHYPRCKHAYGFSRKGAKKLLSSLQPLLKSTSDDTIGQQIKSGNIKAYIPYKPIFYQNRKELGSTLNNHDSLEPCTRNR